MSFDEIQKLIQSTGVEGAIHHLFLMVEEIIKDIEAIKNPPPPSAPVVEDK
jgi:hypothetical protein